MTLLESTQSNLELVTETTISQAATIKELKEQLAKLEAANSKLTNKLKYSESTILTLRTLI